MHTVPLRHRWTALVPAVALVVGAAASSAPATAFDGENDATTEAAYSETYVDATSEEGDVTFEAEVYVETEDPALTTGTLTFTEGGTVVGSAPVSAESDVADGTEVVLVLRNVPAGKHSYVAEFTPATADVEESSDTDSVTVRAAGSSASGKAGGKVSIEVKAPSTVRRGARAAVVVTLTSAKAAGAASIVTATVASKTYRATLRNGKATFRIRVARRTKVIIAVPGTPSARRAVTIEVGKAAG